MPNSIAHYFTIINSDASYFLTSSYGSDHICAPYNIEPISNIDEFFNFCNAMKTKSNIEAIKSFMERYFFANVEKQRHAAEAIEFNEQLRA